MCSLCFIISYYLWSISQPGKTGTPNIDVSKDPESNFCHCLTIPIATFQYDLICSGLLPIGQWQAHVVHHAEFHLGGAGGALAPPLIYSGPPLIEVAVVLFLRSNPFLGPL